MQHYVCGFLFSKDKERVVLVEKNRPDWMKGSLNGVGGKIEDKDQSVYHAMVREYAEETGVATTNDDWMLFASLTVKDGVIHFLKGFSDSYDQVRTMESEIVGHYHVSALSSVKTLQNLQWLIPMALDQDLHFAECNGI